MCAARILRTARATAYVVRPDYQMAQVVELTASKSRGGLPVRVFTDHDLASAWVQRHLQAIAPPWAFSLQWEQALQRDLMRDPAAIS